MFHNRCSMDESNVLLLGLTFESWFHFVAKELVGFTTDRLEVVQELEFVLANKKATFSHRE